MLGLGFWDEPSQAGALEMWVEPNIEHGDSGLRRHSPGLLRLAAHVYARPLAGPPRLTITLVSSLSFNPKVHFLLELLFYEAWV